MKPVISSFPRIFNGVRTATEQAEFFKACGYTHGDLLIRDGFVVNNHSTSAEFEAVWTAYQAVGVQLYGAITDLNEPCEEMEKILSFCAHHGLRSIKIGQYPYRNGTYRELFVRAREALTGLEALSKRYGVQILVQNHGGTVNSSPSLSRSLVDGFDPDHIAVYYDAGNMMRLDGHEAWALGIDILGPYLRHVGIKNVAWFRDENGCWTRDFCPLRDGVIDYREVLAALRANGYAGDYAVHSFYLPDNSIHDPKSIREACDDLAYFKSLLAETEDAQ